MTMELLTLLRSTWVHSRFLVGFVFCLIFCFMCNVLSIVVCHFVLFLLAIVLSVLLLFTVGFWLPFWYLQALPLQTFGSDLWHLTFLFWMSHWCVIHLIRIVCVICIINYNALRVLLLYIWNRGNSSLIKYVVFGV